VFLFWRQGCSHCERAIAYLAEAESRAGAIDVRYYELNSSANRQLYRAAVERLGLLRIGVPLIVIGDQPIVGYLDDSTTGREIEDLIALCRRDTCANALASLPARSTAEDDPTLALAEVAAQTAPPAVPAATPEATSNAMRIRLPVIGEVDLRALSLPLLTVTLGAVDGFNPCAMWVLVFLTGLLLGLQDRARRWLLGGLFLMSTAAAYYMVVAAWLNTLLILGLIDWLRVAIGIVALAGGVYYVHEYFRHPELLCRVANASRRERVTARLKAAVTEPRFLTAATAIVVLAVGVNFIELLCSAGIPAVYTQILALTPMPAWQHHAWLALYVLVFLLDDLAVFAAAMITLEVTGAGSRYAHHTQLVGGVTLAILGVLLVFRPQWLQFG
jgi:glutaredoxin